MTLETVLETLAKSVVSHTEGDVLEMAGWVKLLEQIAAEHSDRKPLADELAALVRTAIREGAGQDFLSRLGRGLDELAAPQAKAAPDSLWKEHGPAFVSDAKNRLSRAQELVLAAEDRPGDEAVAELFRIFHTIKGEAGFLHRHDLSSLTHGIEEHLDAIRSGRAVWDGATASRLLADIDAIGSALVPGEASSRTEEILRVPAAKIDALISQVGELLIALESESGEPSPTVRKLSKGLQQSALRLRTEPLHDLFGRLRRGGRDLALSLNKPVEIAVVGETLELDRNLISLLEEPMMHLLRNAMDHGLESPRSRAEVGKPSTGRLRLEASRRGNRIQIVVEDDGKGLDTSRIWEKAVEKGLASGPRPDDKTVHALIFRPGFSTAESLTQVSGRGVGMDIVASVVGSARGSVDVQSKPGAGTRVALSFPLSTAVIEVLVVRLGERRFVLPVQSVRESLTLDAVQLRAISPDSRVFSLRGEALPVLSLRAALGEPETEDPAWGVVLETNQERQLLLVDEVESKKEVVIRSLGPQFQHLKGVSAATVLAGGRLALVLDADQLVRLSPEAAG